MAFSTGTFANTDAGSLITLLDTALPANAKWSIYDAAAAANCKVYRCYDADGNCDFYFRVDDNYVGYAIIQLWEGWDADAHAGVGASVTAPGTSTTMRIFRNAGGYGISVHDHFFKFYNSVFCAYYIGQPRRYTAAKNIVIVICEGAGTTDYNPLAYQLQASSTTAAVGEALFDENGSQKHLQFVGDADATQIRKTEAGTFDVEEVRIFNYTTNLLIGVVDGVTHHYNAANGFSNGETVTIDGVDWIALGGSNATKYWSLFKQD